MNQDHDNNMLDHSEITLALADIIYRRQSKYHGKGYGCFKAVHK